ncbi:MFS transporter [Streptomyces griseofuscus]|uniref:MFS transporter n=1 Tax=Streptomyces griseofuscus TaxID=146922 RepID=UPI00382EE2FC
MLPAAPLGDRFGRRRTLIAGLGVFLACSVLGALAGGVNAVIAARAVTGVGTALIMPLSPAVLPALFGPDERGKAAGMISAASALGIGVCLLLLPETRGPSGPQVDPLSTALTAAGLGALIYAVTEAPDRGWADPPGRDVRRGRRPAARPGPARTPLAPPDARHVGWSRPGAPRRPWSGSGRAWWSPRVWWYWPSPPRWGSVRRRTPATASPRCGCR